MKLRYLHLGNYPPFKDMAVRFASGSPLQRECAIHFVIGINGSGKSNLLRAIAEVFLAVADERLPQFPLSLIYELGKRGTPGHRSVVIDSPGSKAEASLWMSERFSWPDDAGTDEFENTITLIRANSGPPPHGFSALVPPGNWPQRADIALPMAVLAYTTGALEPWEVIWRPAKDSQGVDLATQGEGYDPTDERPVGWTAKQEAAVLVASGTSSNEKGGSLTSETGTSQDLFRRPTLLTPVLLKSALLAVALPQDFYTMHPARPLGGPLGSPTPLAKLLERGGWHHLVSVAFRSRLQSKLWTRALRETAHDWLMCSGEVIAEPHPTEIHRTLFFDLKGGFSGQEVNTLLRYDYLTTCTTQGEALWTLLGGHDASAFALFSKLVELHQAGLFDDVELRLRRDSKPSEEFALDEDLGVLRFEELSDGEQMVLGRMALFYLLEGQQDALLLLDEPETHFNDKWKREIIDIIDAAVGRTANDVLISTHSAIVLSDVFNDEIVMVHKTPEGSRARSVDHQTFATDPSALMISVFDADDSIGQRAREFIESKLRQATGTADDILQLERLIARMGAGFYRSELRTLLNKWRGIESA
jgi:predicted ATPase